MQSTSPQYVDTTDGTKGVLRAPFVYNSFYCLNMSDKWVYVSPGSSGSTSVSNVLYSHVLPPFSQAILPGVGEYLAYLVSSDAAFSIVATVGQSAGDARIVFIMYEYPFTMPLQGLPGTTIAAELVSGDLSVNRLHALIAAAIGAGVVDDTIKLLITPNATTEMGLRIQGLASQSASLLEVLDSTSAVMFDVDAGGIVHIGSLTDNSVVLTGVSGRLTTDPDITFTGTRLTVTDLTVTSSPIISALTQGRVLIAGSSKEITDDAGMAYNATTNKLTVSGGIIDSALTAGRVAIVGTSGELADDADLTFSGTRLTVTDLTVSTDLRLSTLTSGRLVIASTGGALIDSSALLWVAGATLEINPGALKADNVAVTTLTNGRVVFAGASSVLTDDADMTFSGATLTVTNVTSSGVITKTLTSGGSAALSSPGNTPGLIGITNDANTYRGDIRRDADGWYIATHAATTQPVPLVKILDVGELLVDTRLVSTPPAAQTLTGNGQTITLPTTGFTKEIASAAARTGTIIAAGAYDGQIIVIFHSGAAANTVTMAAAATSNVANGVTCVLRGLEAAAFIWDSGASRWFPIFR